MKQQQIVEAWTNADYFFSLSDEERQKLPDNPVGMVELSQETLRDVLGASHSTCWMSCHRTVDPCCSDTCYTASCCCCC